MTKKFIYLMTAVVILTTAITSCEKDKEVTYKVTFDSKGGTPTPQEQTVKEGGKVTKPADPTRENFSFAGWSKADNATSALWNFETETVTEDITLFAQWVLNTYAVTFDSDGGGAVTAQNVAHGGVATKPANPMRNGYEFDGWFNGETEWSFTTAITAAVTLKAKWTAVHIVTFNSDGGSVVPAQTIRNGNKATKPTNPTKAWIAAAGLYLGVPPLDGNYTFDGWYNGETLWDFDNDTPTGNITLKAKWTIDFSLTRIVTVPTNDVPAAFTYANANSTGVEEYALLLDANVIIGEQSVNSANVKLTIIGIGVERFITANSSNGRLFSIDGNNVNLTIGQNVTLMGKNGTNTHLIHIQRGTLTMRGGSKITGHSFILSGGNVILVEGLNACFKMEGGEISGNSVRSSFGYSIVYIGAGATFEMSGGSITGNTNNAADVFIADANCIFRLSGSAEINNLMLYANNNTTRSTVTINGNYSGRVTVLHLGGNSSNTSNTVASYWTNAPVIVNGTAGVISMFNNGVLGNFSNSSGQFWGGASIRATHELNSAGVLVLK